MNTTSKWTLALVFATVPVSAVITSQSANAATFTTLHSFLSTNGGPYGAPIQATNGDLYGTTQEAAGAYGAVFKITPSGTLTMLHIFDGTDGANPESGLIQATNGDLYGTTYQGGANSVGTVFKITPGGTLTTLHSFDTTDGAYPESGLIQATNGDLYGTTIDGGANCTSSGGCGTVFKITPGGTLTTLYSFCSQTNCTDGTQPESGLMQATNGDLYGTTYQGGANGKGTVFKITPGGTLTTLHSFDTTDGEYPSGALIQATNGDLYGTAQEGGSGFGTVFQITLVGTLTTRHNFVYSDGAYPYAGLMQATNGDLYGTVQDGGTTGVGTVFKITPGGTLTTLHIFDSTDGSYPLAGLTQDTNGKLYGTTTGGGADANGTVFSLSLGLAPFVETQTTSGKVGVAVKILGSNLTGSTSVTFNGTAATFTVVSRSEITTTVPTGATTGTVEVTTPGGTLKSNKKFTVTP